MLGKLYITPYSSFSAEKLHIVANLAQEAIDNKVAADAPSRTALNKLHTMIKKAMGGDVVTITKQTPETDGIVVGEVEEEGETIAPSSVLEDREKHVQEEEGGGGGGGTELDGAAAAAGSEKTMILLQHDEGTTVGHDSLLEELLVDDDGDVEMSL